MPLADPSIRYRKFLWYGDTNSGKTYNLIKEAITRHEKGHRLHLIDPDDGTGTDLDEFPDGVKDMISYYRCTEFDQLIGDLNTAVGNVKPDDCLAVDMADVCWNLAQSEFIKKVFGATEIGRYYLEMRRELERHPVITKSGGVDKQPNLDGWTDWVPIKKRHNDDFMDRIKMLPRDKSIDVIVTTAADKLKISGKFADPGDVISTFAPVGYKPEGEKHNPFRFDTIMFFSTSGGEYYVQALKNRGKRLFPRTMIPEGYSAMQVWEEESAIQKKLSV